MSIRAVIFDVYKTILRVRPRDADHWAGDWSALLKSTWPDPPSLSYETFRQRCAAAVARDHAEAKDAGIAYPEVCWPRIARAALPELAALDDDAQAEFVYQHIQIERSVDLMPDAKPLLVRLAGSDLRVGVASNAQAYTLREVREALAHADAPQEFSDPSLRFWSFENGFSKPNPHVFRILNARLAHLGLEPSQILMVGDRRDNDIAPSQAQGWRAWQMTYGESAPDARLSGDWKALAQFLEPVL